MTTTTKKNILNLMQKVSMCGRTTQNVLKSNNLTLSFFTLEETLDAEVGHSQAQHGQLVQFGDDIRGERQQVGQSVQLRVQPVPVPLGGVGFLVGRGRLPNNKDTNREERVNKSWQHRKDEVLMVNFLTAH